MSHPEPPADDIEAIQRDIEATRAELGETVEALTAKLDVKARAKDKASEATDAVKDRASETVEFIKDAAHDPRTAASTVSRQAGSAWTDHRRAVLVGAGAALFVLVVLRRRSS